MLRNVLNTSWRESIELEHRVAEIVHQQEINGWYFDIELARQNLRELEAMISEIDDKLRPSMPQIRETIKNPEILAPFKKNGDLSERVKAWFDDQDCVYGPFSKVQWKDINLGSDKQIKDFLFTQGWVPTDWNYDDDGNRTSPKLTESSFDSITGGLGKLISTRIKIRHRYGQIEGLISNVRPDGRISAQANTIGTPTGRFTHRVVVNIPKADPKVFFGKQMRAMFTVPPGRVLIGVDAKGLENRMLGHYLNDRELIDILLDGDFHTRVWDTIRVYVHSRNNTKNVEYALFYGAGDEKLGKMADYRPEGWSYADTGAAIRASIMKGLPALEKLTKGVQAAAKQRGYLYGLDRRKLVVRSQHSALNTLLQSAGAIVMKKALVLLDDMIKEHKLDALFVGNFHDEFCIDCAPEHVDKCMELCYNAISQAGKHFNLNVPIEGDGKTGLNWSETH